MRQGAFLNISFEPQLIKSEWFHVKQSRPCHSYLLSFLHTSPVVGIIKTRQSWKFELVTPSCFQNIAFLRFRYVTKGHKIATLENDVFVHKITSRLARTLNWYSQVFFTQGSQKSHFKHHKINCFGVLYMFV